MQRELGSSCRSPCPRYLRDSPWAPCLRLAPSVHHMRGVSPDGLTCCAVRADAANLSVYGSLRLRWGVSPLSCEAQCTRHRQCCGNRVACAPVRSTTPQERRRRATVRSTRYRDNERLSQLVWKARECANPVWLVRREPLSHVEHGRARAGAQSSQKQATAADDQQRLCAGNSEVALTKAQERRSRRL